MKRINIIMCEGKHDIAFLKRVLVAYGFKKGMKKIPSNLKNMYQTEINKAFENRLKEEEKVKLDMVVNYKVPSLILEKDESLYCFHNLGGQKTINERKEVKKFYAKLKPKLESKDIESKDSEEYSDNYEEDDYTQENLEIKFRFIYFFDADEKLYGEKIEDLKGELEVENLEHCEVVKKEADEIGCYIFHDPQTEKGELEDLVIYILKENQENTRLCELCEEKQPCQDPKNCRSFKEKLDSIKSFLKKEKYVEKRSKKFSNKQDNYKKTSEFKEKKAILGLLNQLQFSGSSNDVFLKKTDCLRNEVVRSNDRCKEIVEFLEKKIDL